MNSIPTRRHALQTVAALAASLALPNARACEYFGSTLRITHPWTRASAHGATTAIVCMTFDEVTEPERLVGVETPVAAGAELGGLAASAVLDFEIPAGRETQLAEAGTYLRLTGLQHPLQVARSYPLRLHFEKSGVVVATLNVDYARFF